MNILLIFADQMNRHALGRLGNDDIFTPNLDRLASEGVLFRQAYSNCPVCTPFRINLFTGEYAAKTGCYANSAAIPDTYRTMADAFNAGGFASSFVGKWHIGAPGNQPVPEELRGGFQRFLGYQSHNGFRKNVCFYDESGRERRFDRHRTDVTTDLAIERLEELAGEPFLHVVAYQAPHYPVQPSPEFEELYRDVELSQRPNYRESDPYTPLYSPSGPQPFENCPDYQRYGGDMMEYQRLYYGMVSQIDAGVGRLLAALERLGLAEDTAVFFTSDHGDMQGSHGLLNKSQPFEESSGIPLIARLPGGAENLVSDALVSGVDFFPTFLDLAGLPPQTTLPGANFAATLRGENQALDGPVFAERPQWRMVRKGDFKLTRYIEGEARTTLFNLAEDPFEMNDLAGDSEHAGVVAELMGILAIWGS